MQPPPPPPPFLADPRVMARSLRGGRQLASPFIIALPVDFLFCFLSPLSSSSSSFAFPFPFHVIFFGCFAALVGPPFHAPPTTPVSATQLLVRFGEVMTATGHETRSYVLPAGSFIAGLRRFQNDRLVPIKNGRVNVDGPPKKTNRESNTKSARRSRHRLGPDFMRRQPSP